jgi:hypothetical protein
MLILSSSHNAVFSLRGERFKDIVSSRLDFAVSKKREPTGGKPLSLEGETARGFSGAHFLMWGVFVCTDSEPLPSVDFERRNGSVLSLGRVRWGTVSTGVCFWEGRFFDFSPRGFAACGFAGVGSGAVGSGRTTLSPVLNWN